MCLCLNVFILKGIGGEVGSYLSLIGVGGLSIV